MSTVSFMCAAVPCFAVGCLVAQRQEEKKTLAVSIIALLSMSCGASSVFRTPSTPRFPPNNTFASLSSSPFQENEGNQGLIPPTKDAEDLLRANVLIHVAYRNQTELWLDNESSTDAYSRLLATRTLRNNRGRADSMPSKTRSRALAQLPDEKSEDVESVQE